MQLDEIVASANATNVAANWEDAHRYTPSCRHRRRLILDWLRPLQFNDCLDAGCAQAFLLQAIVQQFGVAGFGGDVSDEVIAHNRQAQPNCSFEVLDLMRDAWPGGRQFDLVVCSEVLEHLPDWQAAVANLARMAGKELLITVPSGKLRTLDRMLGHHRTFAGPELCAEIESHGLSVVRRAHWGFPFYSLYKVLVSGLSPARLYESFAGGRPYGPGKKLVAKSLDLLFYANDLFPTGCLLLIHARRKS
ncbi:MAG TPA: class I SAM-dependent methyltransferase [Gemmataceae bacterium]|nr:class I SAM-dependent methyltransferase [Gemmataceae bacterium]